VVESLGVVEEEVVVAVDDVGSWVMASLNNLVSVVFVGVVVPHNRSFYCWGYYTMQQ
jgi:hypothetical protein